MPSSDQNRHFTYFCFSIVEVKYFVSFSRMTFPTFPFFVFDRWFCFGKNGLLLFVNVRDIGSKPLNYVDAHGENKSHQVLIGILRHQTQQEKLNNRSPYGNEYQYYIIITCLIYLPTRLFIVSSILCLKKLVFQLILSSNVIWKLSFYTFCLSWFSNLFEIISTFNLRPAFFAIRKWRL